MFYAQRRPLPFSLTRSPHATTVGPIRFSNRSNNCRVGRINERRLSLVRLHHAIFVFSSSLRPTKDENRMVCTGLTYISSFPTKLSHKSTYPTSPSLQSRFTIPLTAIRFKFLYPWILFPNTGKIPDKKICTTLACFVFFNTGSCTSPLPLLFLPWAKTRKKSTNSTPQTNLRLSVWCSLEFLSKIGDYNFSF